MSCSMILFFEIKSQLKAWINLGRRGREIPAINTKSDCICSPDSEDAASIQFPGHMLVRGTKSTHNPNQEAIMRAETVMHSVRFCFSQLKK